MSLTKFPVLQASTVNEPRYNCLRPTTLYSVRVIPRRKVFLVVVTTVYEFNRNSTKDNKITD